MRFSAVEDLVKSGPVVASVTARAVEPLPGTFAGIIVRLDGAEPHDRTPVDDPAVNPLSPAFRIMIFTRWKSSSGSVMTHSVPIMAF